MTRDYQKIFELKQILKLMEKNNINNEDVKTEILDLIIQELES